MGTFCKKLFLLAVLAGALSVFIFCTVYFGIPGVYKDYYQKGFVYQYRALQRADTGRPKIILTGASDMTFAVDSEKLSKELGMPVYTLGIHAGMGMNYNIETAEEFVNEGDTVVLFFRPFEKDDYGMDLIYLSLEDEDDMFRSFFRKHPLQCLKAAGPAASTKLFNLARDSVLSAFHVELDRSAYQAEAFDEETGNLIYKRDGCICGGKDLYTDTRYDIVDVDEDCFEIINRFSSFCRDRGACLYMAHSPIFEGAVVSRDEEIAAYEQALSERIAAHFIVDIEDGMFPESYIFDGAKHMNDLGKACYTGLLARALKQVL